MAIGADQQRPRGGFRDTAVSIQNDGFVGPDIDRHLASNHIEQIVERLVASQRRSITLAADLQPPATGVLFGAGRLVAPRLNEESRAHTFRQTQR